MLRKLALVLIVAAGLAAAARRIQAGRAEADLWAEATEPIDLR